MRDADGSVSAIKSASSLAVDCAHKPAAARIKQQVTLRMLELYRLCRDGLQGQYKACLKRTGTKKAGRDARWSGIPPQKTCRKLLRGEVFRSANFLAQD